MKKKRRGPKFPLAQFIAIIVITLCLFLVVDFARRTAATYKIKNEAARLEEEVAAVHAYREVLQARLSYVQSDAYVEEIARTELKWALPGETVVVVMATPQPSPTPAQDTQSPEPEPPLAQEPWEAWWFLFFDKRPLAQLPDLPLNFLE